MTKTIVPPIKSQGIKTKLVPWIESLIPDDFDGLWVEPFMGTGAVGFNIKCRKALMCDTNPHLINFYNAIKSGEITPEQTRKFLNREGTLLLEKGQDHYYEIRERFNEDKDPMDFLFINRSCFNGMIRFNRKGGFNVPFCRKPNRFAQAYVTKITNQVDKISAILEKRDISFVCQTFMETIKMADGDSIIYCDPPYIDRHADYFNGWEDEDEKQLFHSLQKSESQFILSTWHHNDYRENTYIPSLWSQYNVLTKEHFYHVGASEKNRSSMIEALVTNIDTKNMDDLVNNTRMELVS